jgi:hypothetical protein
VDVPTACCEVIEPLIGDWLDAVDDSLFEMAEHADDGGEHFLDSLREIRHHRQAIINGFLDSLDMACYRYSAGQACVAWRNADELRPSSDLLPGAELDYALANLQSQGERKHRQSLQKLYRRMGEIRGVVSLDHVGSPVSPPSLCGAIRDSMRDVPIDDRSVVVVAKMFGRHFIDPLDEICEELLVALYRSPREPEPNVDAGSGDVLERGVRAATQLFSQVRGLIKRRQESEAENTAGEAPALDFPEPDSPTEDNAKAAEPQVADGNGDTLEEDQPPIEPQADGTEPEEIPETPAEPEVMETEISGELLQSALMVLQARALREEMDHEALSGIDAIRHEMLAQVDRLWTSEDRPVLSADQETELELAGMVFAFMHDDETLRPAIKTLLARLLVPYVRVALLEPELFASPSHSARQLLDQLVETATRFGDNAGLKDKLQEVVHRILSDFEEDCSLFEPFLDSFGRYAEHLHRTALQAERKAAKVDVGRERVREARKNAAQAIGELTRDTDLPEAMGTLLKRPWVNVMALTWLRHGGDSGEWRQAQQFVTDLLWGLEPKDSAADVARLQSMMPAISRQLGNGLAEVAFEKDDMRQVFADLREIYRERLDERYRDALHLPESFGPIASFVSRSKLTSSDDAAPEGTPVSPGQSLTGASVPSNDEVWLEAVRGLQPGAWFDFKNDSGKTIRAKLSWVNPFNHTLLFVDSDGLKLDNKSATDFAAELQSGEATLLENVPLFERAMAAISERLRQERQQAGQT